MLKIQQKYWIFGILILAAMPRLYGIDTNIIGRHSWRQADTAAIARNFAVEEYNIFSPRIDWRGNTPGYCETEFQIYPFIVAAFYRMFGVNVIWARLLSVIFSLIGLYFLYLLVLKSAGLVSALWTGLFYAVLPFNVFYSRTVQPEAMMMMSLIVGVYFFFMYTKTDKILDIVLSGIFISIACLIKPHMLYIGLPLFWLAWLKYKTKMFSKWQMWMFVALIFIPLVLWYWHSYNTYLKYGLTFGVIAGNNKWANWNFLLSHDFRRTIFAERFSDLFLLKAGMAFFMLGLIVKRKTKEEFMFDFWLVGAFVYLFVVGWGNYVHEYYQLPFFVLFAVFLGKAFSQLTDGENRKKLESFIYLPLLTALVFLSLLFMVKHGRTKFIELYEPEYVSQKDNKKLLDISDKIKQVTGKNDLVVTVADGYPVMLYLSDRKGWIVPGARFGELIGDSINKGAVYVAGFKDEIDAKELEKLTEKYKTVVNEKEIIIIKFK